MTVDNNMFNKFDEDRKRQVCDLVFLMFQAKLK